ncbi:hypothetical protein E2C01_021046 [Portunus trituberculatus]|uniref:Uncharacterized protein n=1 Tax=Portunus trituberculatus TaxID=210409 RepID=A0A5B7E366_PORTR|nr:hypothetical protein [Portunus trituberculatus]
MPSPSLLMVPSTSCIPRHVPAVPLEQFESCPPAPHTTPVTLHSFSSQSDVKFLGDENLLQLTMTVIRSSTTLDLLKAGKFQPSLPLKYVRRGPSFLGTPKDIEDDLLE